jgi:hypothetical protein
LKQQGFHLEGQNIIDNATRAVTGTGKTWATIVGVLGQNKVVREVDETVSDPLLWASIAAAKFRRPVDRPAPALKGDDYHPDTVEGRAQKENPQLQKKMFSVERAAGGTATLAK